jgi:hypothetical protein
MKCEKCGVEMDYLERDRWVVCDEVIACPGVSLNGRVEIDTLNSTALGYYCSEQHAFEVIDQILSGKHAVVNWSEASQIEVCTTCARKFKAEEPHYVLALAVERGNEGTEDHETVDVKYAARFCNGCEPI